MCGIAGFSCFDNDYTKKSGYWTDILIQMRKSIAHRGNDTTGQWLDKNIGLSQTRLTIRDLTGGNQPIIRQRNGVTYAIIYNGEIYNTDELNTDLISKGYVFETKTDTETILYQYMEYGPEGVKALNGIFAFAIWDSAEECIYLFRDRSGIKPLFYTIQNNTLIFGSELKALFQHPYITPEINEDSLRQILGIGPARTEGNGVFKNIYEIKYGHIGKFSAYGFNEYPYWQLESKEHTDTYEETVDKVKYLIKDAVTKQMVADVPVCCFLSGGVDSCIVTALASNYLKEQQKILNTFSFDFTENDTYFKSNSFQPEQDRPYVDKMLKMYKLNHTYLECNETDLADLLYTAVDAKDLPGMADIDASLLYFCSLVKKKNKVTLTGECADEIFGGYPWFHKEEFINADTFPWSINLDTRTQFFNKDLLQKLKLNEYVHSEYKKSISQVPRLDKENEIEKKRREISFLNLKWFMTTLLSRMDITSMYSGLEARVPFADHRIIEYLWNVPWKYKCPNGIVKGLLRESAKDLLPNEILYRKKSPYPKTYNPKYENILAQRLTDIIMNNSSPITPLIDKTKVIDFIKSPQDYGKPWFGQLMAAPQMMAYLIQINYWMEKYHLSI